MCLSGIVTCMLPSLLKTCRYDRARVCLRMCSKYSSSVLARDVSMCRRGETRVRGAEVSGWRWGCGPRGGMRRGRGNKRAVRGLATGKKSHTPQHSQQWVFRGEVCRGEEGKEDARRVRGRVGREVKGVRWL